ncbi:MAG: nucleotide sugar dehydrogenase [Clostridium sp.]
MLFEKIRDEKEKIAVIGLGYVGMPLAVAFAKKVGVIGFDLNQDKIKEYLKGKDITNEVGDEEIKKTTVRFTNDEKEIRNAKFHIVAVPTPINGDKTPDLKPVVGASEIVGRNLTRGSIVVFESTVYPGVTEDICVPILERESNLKYGIDFKVGYSPERINPGDKVNRLETIVKIVSGMDGESLEDIANIYELVIEAGVHRAESIKVAEAAKVIENSQRDINIAFMNELSIIFNQMGIDTKSVLEAAGTKWNFLKFSPGLVGGHCIGVDPYYLTYKAEQEGYHSQIISSGRRINDDMGKYIASVILKKMIEEKIQIKDSKVAFLGVTFKENCPDTRNTKVIDIINELSSYGINVLVTDPVANKDEFRDEYKFEIKNIDEIENVDCVVIAVAHNEFKELSINEIRKLYLMGEEELEIAATSLVPKGKVLIDIKGILDKKVYNNGEFSYWRL